MAMLNVRVNIPSAVLPDTLANRRRVFVYAGNSANIAFGNVPRKVAQGQYAYDLNNPSIPGAVTVTSYGRAHFASEDLAGQPALVGNLAQHVEAGYIIVEDDAAPGVPLNRTALEAYL